MQVGFLSYLLKWDFSWNLSNKWGRESQEEKKVLAIAVLTSDLACLLNSEKIPEIKICSMYKSYFFHLNINTACCSALQILLRVYLEGLFLLPTQTLHIIWDMHVGNLVVITQHLFCVWFTILYYFTFGANYLRNWTLLQQEHSTLMVHLPVQCNDVCISWEHSKVT